MRTVFSIDLFGGTDPGAPEQALLSVVRTPFDVEHVDLTHSFDLTSDMQPPWGTPDAVRRRGEMVRASLCAHPAAQQLFDLLPKTTRRGELRPLFIKLSESDAELISWETLCDNKGAFVALDPRWPIGRLIDPKSGLSRPPR